jgi:hypothetical protein
MTAADFTKSGTESGLRITSQNPRESGDFDFQDDRKGIPFWLSAARG